MKEPIVIDGRNMYEAQEMAEKGFAYYGMGRGEITGF
jgi:UDPglucose 6-dehydrogenase